MSIKKTIQIGLFILLAACLLFPVSCKKRMPESPMVTGQENAPAASEATEAGRNAAQGAAASAMGEENLSPSSAGAATGTASTMTAASQAAAARDAFVAKKIYFDFDDATLSNDAIRVLTGQARWLRMNSGVSIIIEGYCDERGTDEYNLALGARRAESVKTFLVKAGIDGKRMMKIGRAHV